jgi:hypothetical protein
MFSQAWVPGWAEERIPQGLKPSGKSSFDVRVKTLTYLHVEVKVTLGSAGRSGL